MKKEDQELTLLDTDISSKRDFKKDSYKTTNVNILLNRVRLDKKRSFKKKIIFLFLLMIVIGIFFYFFLV